MARRERRDEGAVTQDEVDAAASSGGGATDDPSDRSAEDSADDALGARTPPVAAEVEVDAETELGPPEARTGADRSAAERAPGRDGAGPDGVGPEGVGPESAALAQDRESASAEVSDEELEREVAALLFASPEPLSESKLAALLDGTPQVRVRLALDALKQRLAASGLPWEVRSIAGGWQLYTSEALADTVGRLAKVRKDEKVSPAGLETLAIVAYRQPVTKGEIEAIRGVQVGPILRTLVDRGLVKVAGRSDDPGRPLLYGTTRKFLDSFGLGSLDDLPRDGELLRD
jgi:segregation and condensation protein B